MKQTNEITKTMTEELIDATQRLYRGRGRDQRQRVFNLLAVLSEQKLLNVMTSFYAIAYAAKEDKDSSQSPFTIIADSCKLILMYRHFFELSKYQSVLDQCEARRTELDNVLDQADVDVKRLIVTIFYVFYK